MRFMSVLVIGLWIAFFLVAFAARSFVQYRRTGDAGFRLSRSASRAARIASALMTLGMLGGFAGAIFHSTGIGAIAALDSTVLEIAGLIVVIAATLFTAKAQFDLRESWRIGVDERERTELVTNGIYASVRNPIFTGMLLFTLGSATASPTWVGVAAILVALTGFELQVRGIEEPYLARTHGTHFRAYAAHAGRFVPLVGRIRDAGRPGD